MPANILPLIVFIFSFVIPKQAIGEPANKDNKKLFCFLNEGQELRYSGESIGFYHEGAGIFRSRIYINPMPESQEDYDIPAERKWFDLKVLEFCYLRTNRTVKVLDVFPWTGLWGHLKFWSKDMERYFVYVEVLHGRSDCLEKITYLLEIKSCGQEGQIFVSTVNDSEEQQNGILREL